MELTEIRMFVCDEPRLKATLTLTFDDAFVVKGVKVILGRNGLFVAMPSRRTETGFEDICHPVTPEFRRYLELEVMQEYARRIGRPWEEIRSQMRREEGDPEDPGTFPPAPSDGPRTDDPRDPREGRNRSDPGDPGLHPS